MISLLNKSTISSKDKLILHYCKDKNVLDVGCVGQDKHFNNHEWIHAKIKSVSNNLQGTDINIAEIATLNEMGYSIITPDKLKEGSKFQVITILDVIEHVDNVVEFLNYYTKFLDTGGALIVTTPNPFNFRQVLNILLFKFPSVNEEHTIWIDPINFKEIAKRCNLKAVEFYWLEEYFIHKKLYWRILDFILIKPICFFRKYYLPNYAIILTNNE